MSYSIPELPSAVNRDLWVENIRKVAEMAVSRYEKIHGVLPEERRAAAFQSAQQALRAHVKVSEPRDKDILESMFAAAESALVRAGA